MKSPRIRTVLVTGAVGIIIISGVLTFERPSQPTEPEGSQTRTPDSIELTGRLPAELRESSGVAASRSHPGVLWTHNDSGHRAIVYAIGFDGSVMVRVQIEEARARDWEDISLGPCPAGVPNPLASDECLYIADTGDNNRNRERARLYVIPEPDPRADSPVDRVAVMQQLDLQYPDGPRDVEAVAVTPGGTIYLVTKGWGRNPEVYTVAGGAGDGVAEVSVTLNKLSSLEIQPFRMLGRLVSGAAIAPEGDLMVIRTYTELYRYRLDPETGGMTPLGTPCFFGPIEPLGEAVDFVDRETVVLTSESLPGRPGTIYRVTC